MMAMPTKGRHPQTKRSTLRRSRGFTLVEILVTLLIVSIGLLGIAALHSFSLRNNYDALLRSHASALASDIADRMRANLPAIRIGNNFVANSDYEVNFDEEVEPDDDSSQATLDIAEWKAALDQQLPDGDGQIAINEGTGIVTIAIRWGERDEDSPVVTFTTETEI